MVTPSTVRLSTMRGAEGDAKGPSEQVRLVESYNTLPRVDHFMQTPTHCPPVAAQREYNIGGGKWGGGLKEGREGAERTCGDVQGTGACPWSSRRREPDNPCVGAHGDADVAEFP